MKILVVHEYFLTAGDSGGSRYNQFAKYWSQEGHEVTVLAGMVSHIGSCKEPQYKGKFITREEDPSGATVYRCHVSESYNKSFLGRFWAYLSFVFSSVIAALFCVKRPDVIVVTSPPLTVAMVMWIVSRIRRVPAVFEVRDLWPESAIDTGVLKSRILIRMSYWLERLAYREARWINALTPAFVEKLVDEKGVPRSRISMIPNGADLDIMIPGPKANHVREKLGLSDEFVISYFGAHGRANRVGQLLDVAELLKTSMPDVRIMLVGDGMEKPMIVEEVRTRGLDNVFPLDAVPKSKVCDYINASDICTAVLMKNDTFKTVYPNKVFDYMSCGRPIILGIDGVARELVENAGSGVFAEPENPEDFCRVIRELRAKPGLLEQMGKNGLAFVREKYSRKHLAMEYIKVLKGIVREKT